MRIGVWSPEHLVGDNIYIKHDFKFAGDLLLILVLGSEFPSSLSQM